MITYSFLQHYWWILISILGAVLVFMLFVQGGQINACKQQKTAANAL